jgi:hypothetical protein
MLKFFACPSGAPSIQKSSCTVSSVARSCCASTELRSTPAKSIMPGPPSASYFRCDGLPSAWQKSSCGRRSHQLPDECSLRSKRSTASTFCAPNRRMAVRGTGTPYACRMFRQSHSFSTEVVKSALRWPTRPSGSFRMCVVGVEPCGRTHWPSCHSRAVFSWAPAREMRSSSSGAVCAANRPGSTVCCSSFSTSASLIGSPSMRSTCAGPSSSPSSWMAPTQSRPMACSRSKGCVVRVLKRLAMRSRIGRLSGSRLSK